MRALISVFDKSGIVDFARQLTALGWEIVSTGGTLRTLQDHGLPAIAVSEVTGFPEILDGRVKTLHPVIHGGLLARLDDPAHRSALNELAIEPIEMVVANLYPFEETVAESGVSVEAAIEQIDIGGPAMLRAAAKNHHHVIVIVDPSDQQRVLSALQSGTVDVEMRRDLAAKAFQHTATYDTLVSTYLRDEPAGFPKELTIAARKLLDLRYGENPHQAAAAYSRIAPGEASRGVLAAEKLQGKELSYNNLLDADAALSVVQGWDRPAAVVVKHTIPCGLAVRSTPIDAFRAALAGDPVSAFGGIVALNRPVNGPLAVELKATFFEVILAPGFSQDARLELAPKKNLRLLQLSDADLEADSAHSVRSIQGALLLQRLDVLEDDAALWNVKSRRSPTGDELSDLRFAWRAVRHIKSNAIVLAREQAIVGVGAGQPNRVESVHIAVRKAAGQVSNAVLASDAFFPFVDGVEAAIAAGVTAIIQPGGSVRDDEVIAMADAAGIAMVFTGTRHFLH